ncbi:OLC1v1027527C1 [Oldenlandia corymbosa var. corymbosa]|uniref:OLC1v1027527C1 n=1 Tax=Oldenlandia corymbosa var. corymbosa TaxID=529605 RepID=A0AAV1CCX8_OLDCO|nr:OLC1v1027527C1 [Oldenlandia corymbosa var. corymbosa]
MMAGKDSNSPQPLVAGDAEAAAANSRELRKKKRIKYLLYFIAFVIFQTAVIAIFVLTIMKVRTPKFRVRAATFDPSNSNTDAATSSFNFTMNTRLDVKNANFGKYKYEETTVNFFYRGTPVGEVSIPKSSVGWRSTKKVNVVVKLGSDKVQSSSELGSELKAGILRINSRAEMKGKVRLIFIFSKKKSTNMDCSMDIAITPPQLVNISCK